MRLLLALTLTLAAAGCSPTGIVETRIAESLPRLIGPADAYTVDVDGLGLSSASAERVAVVGTNVRPTGAPVIARLDVDLRDVQADRTTRRLSRVGSARATARITATALAEAVAAEGVVRDPVVTLAAPDRLTLRGRPVYDGRALPAGTVEASGRLVPADGAVRFEVESVRALGLPLPGAVARELTERVNPVADLRRTRAGLRVTAIRVEAGELVLEMTADPASLTRTASSRSPRPRE